MGGILWGVRVGGCSQHARVSVQPVSLSHITSLCLSHLCSKAQNNSVWLLGWKNVIYMQTVIICLVSIYNVSYLFTIIINIGAIFLLPDNQVGTGDLALGSVSSTSTLWACDQFLWEGCPPFRKRGIDPGDRRPWTRLWVLLTDTEGSCPFCCHLPQGFLTIFFSMILTYIIWN